MGPPSGDRPRACRRVHAHLARGEGGEILDACAARRAETVGATQRCHICPLRLRARRADTAVSGRHWLALVEGGERVKEST
eukprot:6752138-Prymnesium_polylepis.1